jgi:hypothetical protein
VGDETGQVARAQSEISRRRLLIDHGSAVQLGNASSRFRALPAIRLAGSRYPIGAPGRMGRQPVGQAAT